MKKIRILIADDHALMRVGLNTMLNVQPDMTVIGEAANGQETIEQTLALHPDVVIMDLMMPKVDGAEATRRILESRPETFIIILTSYATSADLVRAISNGAVGAQMKGSPISELMAAIRSVASGHKSFPPEIRKLLKENPVPLALTVRQQEILQGVANGRTSEQIADDLGIAVSTVKLHITSICHKLDVSSRSEAVAVALRKNLMNI